MLAEVRHLSFGPVQLRIEGPLCALPWPHGACACESPVADELAVRVSSERVDRLPGVSHVVADGRVWQSEQSPRGLRFAVLADLAGTVIADLSMHAARQWHVRVVDGASSWFDILLQLAVSEVAPAHRGVVLHGACVDLGGRAVLLCGTSRVGKSTLARRLVAAGARPMSHDRTIVFADAAESWQAVSTPWGHDGELAGPERERLVAGVLMLSQSSTCSSARLSGARGAMLLGRAMIGSWAAKAATMPALDVIARLMGEVPCYATGVTNDARASQHVAELFG